MPSPSYVRIDVNKSHVYHITDPVQLSKIFFPDEKAKHKRASFLAIYFALRNANYQKLSPEQMNSLPEKYSLNGSSFRKAREDMKKIGLIRKYGGWWQFSDGFKHSMQKLIGWVEATRTPLDSSYRDQMEYVQIESAKVEGIYERVRKDKD